MAWLTTGRGAERRGRTGPAICRPGLWSGPPCGIEIPHDKGTAQKRSPWKIFEKSAHKAYTVRPIGRGAASGRRRHAGRSFRSSFSASSAARACSVASTAVLLQGLRSPLAVQYGSPFLAARRLRQAEASLPRRAESASPSSRPRAAPTKRPNTNIL